MNVPTMTKFASLLGLGVLLAACGGDDDGDSDNTRTYMYEVSVVNATNAQPLSPVVFAILDSSTPTWEIGAAASEGLAIVAESGSPDTLLSELSTQAVAYSAGNGLVVPGDSDTVTLEAASSETLYLTAATMLVNTNDAFAGVTSWPISDLAVGESQSALAPIYDAGTETNDELAIYIPGPAGGGEGISAGREDHNFVTRHPGVVTQADNYAESALTEAHRFDNGAMLLTITRVQ